MRHVIRWANHGPGASPVTAVKLSQQEAGQDLPDATRAPSLGACPSDSMESNSSLGGWQGDAGPPKGCTLDLRHGCLGLDTVERSRSMVAGLMTLHDG